MSKVTGMLLYALALAVLGAVSASEPIKYEYEYYDDKYPYDEKYPVYETKEKELKSKYDSPYDHDSPLDDEPKYEPVEKYDAHHDHYEPHEHHHYDPHPHYEQEYEKHEYKKTVKCYQCAYSPPRIIEEQVKVPVQDKHGKIYYKTKYVQKETPGGWDKCKGPFDDAQATKFGIDVWDCDSNCFTRTDKSGNVFRGCYRGEFGVDPEKLGCHEQAGSLYCFCKGDRCNYKRAKDLPDKDQYLVEELHREEH